MHARPHTDVCDDDTEYARWTAHEKCRLDGGWMADFVWDYGTPRRGLVREHLIMSYVLYRILATQNLSIPRVFTAHMFFIKIPAV